MRCGQIGSMRFNRMEFAGSLGDLGALLPLAMGMIVVNGLNPVGLFFCVGLFYLLAGTYYRVPIAVQPMKTVAAYSVATGISASVITAAGLWLGVLLLLASRKDILPKLQRFTPIAVIRGVQVSTGVLLATQGLKLVLGRSVLQQVLSEPYLGLHELFSIPWSILIGIAALLTVLFFWDNTRFPSSLVVILGGFFLGLMLRGVPFELGLHAPTLFPFGFPAWADFTFALPMLVLPQLPMTLGNAVFANTDLSNSYFPEGKERVTPRALCVSMGLACIAASFLGGMPMCHGAGGLAAHYRFGARTSGSNIIIGSLFVLGAILLGPSLIEMLRMLPLAVLGTMLFLAGLELCLTVRDLTDRSGLFIVFFMLVVSMTLNLAIAFILSAALSWFMNRRKLRI